MEEKKTYGYYTLQRLAGREEFIPELAEGKQRCLAAALQGQKLSEEKDIGYFQALDKAGNN